MSEPRCIRKTGKVYVSLSGDVTVTGFKFHGGDVYDLTYEDLLASGAMFFVQAKGVPRQLCGKKLKDSIREK